MKISNRKKNIRKALGLRESPTCPNCGKEGPHFVPPSFGEDGYFVCDKPLDKDPLTTV